MGLVIGPSNRGEEVRRCFSGSGAVSAADEERVSIDPATYLLHWSVSYSPTVECQMIEDSFALHTGLLAAFILSIKGVCFRYKMVVVWTLQSLPRVPQVYSLRPLLRLPHSQSSKSSKPR